MRMIWQRRLHKLRDSPTAKVKLNVVKLQLTPKTSQGTRSDIQLRESLAEGEREREEEREGDMLIMLYLCTFAYICLCENATNAVAVVVAAGTANVH